MHLSCWRRASANVGQSVSERGLACTIRPNDQDEEAPSSHAFHLARTHSRMLLVSRCHATPSNEPSPAHRQQRRLVARIPFREIATSKLVTEV